jgi:hypothetical protein
MTIRTNKPAINLREELASLRNQGGYSEQQFWMDGLVTNGKFDADISSWNDDSDAGGTTSWNAAGYLDLVNTTGTSRSENNVAVTAGKVYKVTVDVVDLGGSNSSALYLDNGSSSAMAFTQLGVGTHSVYYVAPDSSLQVGLKNFGAGTTVSIDNVSVFEVDASNDVIHTMPKGWKPKDVFEDGLLQREGSTQDYEVVYDGFDYKIKPTVAPTSTTETCVIGVKA